MSFEEAPSKDEQSQDEKRQESPGWKRLMNFITSEDKVIFRKSLTKINKELYYRLRNLIAREAKK